MQDRIARTMRMKLRKIKNGKIKLVSHDARYSYNQCFRIWFDSSKNLLIFFQFGDYFFCKILYTAIRRAMPSFVMFLWWLHYTIKRHRSIFETLCLAQIKLHYRIKKGWAACRSRTTNENNCCNRYSWMLRGTWKCIGAGRIWLRGRQTDLPGGFDGSWSVQFWRIWSLSQLEA